jgi:hypothetical protein
MAEPKAEHNTECDSPEHGQHLCYLMYDGFHYSHPAEYKAMVKDAEFRCQNCPRTAKHAENLCVPIKL